MRYITETLYEDEEVVCKVITPVAIEENSSMPEDDTVREILSHYDSEVIRPQQTHSVNVRIVEVGDSETEFPDTDALICFDFNLSIGVVTADCVPILLYSPDIKATAAIHAGWKGTIGGIVDNAVAMLKFRGADLALIRAIFGPSIGKDVYEVDFELADKFIAAGFGECVELPEQSVGRCRPHIDLQGVNIRRLERLGIQSVNIHPSDRCTFTTKSSTGTSLYPSYRRQKTSLRLLTLIGCPGKEPGGG